MLQLVDLVGLGDPGSRALDRHGKAGAVNWLCRSMSILDVLVFGGGG